jgi:hypothetical protein
MPRYSSPQAENDARAEIVADLRSVADFIENDGPIPEGVEVKSHHVAGAAGMEGLRDDFMKDASKLGTYTKHAGGETMWIIRRFRRVEFVIFCQRAAVCTRREIGNKTVPEHTVPEHTVPEHTETTYEWECPDSFLAPGKEGEA